MEIVNLRLTATGRRERSSFPVIAAGKAIEAAEYRDVVFDDPAHPSRCAIYEREFLFAGQVIEGPAIITEYASTTLLPPGDRLEVATSGDLMIGIAAP